MSGYVRYWDHVLEREAVKVQPGGYYASASGELIVTTLGSCVSACLYDRKVGIAGMNHFLLPVNNSAAGAQFGISAAARYGDYAMEAIINAMMKLGGSKRRMEVKIFGGAKVIDSMMNIGQQNINFVRFFLANEDMRLDAEDVGGLQPRKIYLYSEDGRIRVKKFRALHNDTLVKTERNYLEEISSTDVGGSVELFTE